MSQTDSPGAVARAEARDCFAEQQAVPDTTPTFQAPARRPNSPAAYRHWRSVNAGPTARELKILRRIAAGGLYVTHRNGGISRSFEDGAPVSRADFENSSSCVGFIPMPTPRR